MTKTFNKDSLEHIAGLTIFAKGRRYAKDGQVVRTENHGTGFSAIVIVKYLQ